MADSSCRAVGAGSDKDFILLASKAYCAYTGKSELGGKFKGINCPFPFKGARLFLTAEAAPVFVSF